ncbi:phospholipid methyltransferase-domain-containing protein [Schizophyllum amplum]|uniref:Phosphatidyl-N-methylethanolamine N-methyltransferase n=1 Tax=Schizophyllum amplum TaxID=97359 RepID=A0A550C8H3_9AGAR|nr:phospholipid methyltransferase-domain-containing protein [Auriculariopsis ampla]
MDALSPIVDTLRSVVDTSKPSLALCLAAIAFNPTAWNIIAQNVPQQDHHAPLWREREGGLLLPRLMIFSFGVLRDTLYERALADQPRVPMLPEPFDVIVPAALGAIGQTFVVTSTWALGITGTFLGDYFGILMDHRVEGFPFNVLRDPMYVGSTMCFAAGALWYERPAGLLITAYVYIVYIIALRFEGPFTDMIYSQRAKKST